MSECEQVTEERYREMESVEEESGGNTATVVIGFDTEGIADAEADISKLTVAMGCFAQKVSEAADQFERLIDAADRYREICHDIEFPEGDLDEEAQTDL